MARRTKRLLPLLVALVVAVVIAFLVGREATETGSPLNPTPAVHPHDKPLRHAQADATTGTPARSRAPDAAPDAGRASDPGTNPPMFGWLVALGQDFLIGEVLARNAANADAYVDRLCEQSRRLQEKSRTSQPTTREHDAASFMAPLIDYEAPLDKPPGALHVADDLSQRLRDYGQDWPMRITDPDLDGLDFGWMEALAAFDHWSLLGDGRLRDAPATDLFSMPIPNYMSLLQWAKLRFALAIRRRDFAAAGTQVRHLAFLVHTQGLLVSEMVSVSFHRLEVRGREAAAAVGADLSEWSAPDAEQLDLERHLPFASIYFTYPGVNPETVRKAIACTPAPCSALFEGAGLNRTLGPHSAIDNSDLVLELAAAKGCEPALIERIRNSPRLEADRILHKIAEDFGHEIPKLLERTK